MKGNESETSGRGFIARLTRRIFCNSRTNSQPFPLQAVAAPLRQSVLR